MMYPDSSAVPDYASLIKLTDRGIIVLGAGDGIGRQSCHALAQAGARVLCVDRDPQLAATIARDIDGIPVGVDVTLRAGMSKVFETAQASFGDNLRGLVDIVGMAKLGELTSLDDAGWDEQFNIVLRHAWLALQFGATAFKQGGSMVFVGSISGVVSVEHQLAYGTAKAALHHLVRSAAHELGPRGIRVNAVAPGYVRTPRLLQRLNEDFWQGIADVVPLRRVAIPSEIASAILFLCSDLSAYVTANVMTLDGGTNVVAALPSFK